MTEPPPPNLLQLFANLYPFVEESRTFVHELGIPTDLISFAGAAKARWDNTLRELRRHATYGEIASQIRIDHPDLPWEFYDERLLDRRPNENMFTLRDDVWKGGSLRTEAELQMSSQSELLPIHFLENGVKASRSVVKVFVPGSGPGTGFLIAENLIVTSNHVLPNARRARDSTVTFNFQSRVDGTQSEGETFELDPSKTFLTSPKSDGDWTIVAVKTDANSEWGALQLADEPADKNSRITIIQHPQGGPKQIAMANNRVAYTDANQLQYLTETSGGSSGSPVLNLDWEVVGIHTEGGFLPEMSGKSRRLFFRNAGIPIASVRQRLIDERLMTS